MTSWNKKESEATLYGKEEGKTETGRRQTDTRTTRGKDSGRGRAGRGRTEQDTGQPESTKLSGKQ